MANVTIKDIAIAAGVSHPTVSKALNNAPGVSDETRRRILKLAAQMNYVPNMAARRLANKGNRSIGFIWPKAEGIFFYHLVNALQEEAGARGIDVLVSMSDSVTVSIAAEIAGTFIVMLRVRCVVVSTSDGMTSVSFGSSSTSS